jgi:hypothetical protein
MSQSVPDRGNNPERKGQGSLSDQILALGDALSPEYDHVINSKTPEISVEPFKNILETAAQAHAKGDTDAALEHLMDARDEISKYGGSRHHKVSKFIDKYINSV